jgi:hypothetical protein
MAGQTLYLKISRVSIAHPAVENRNQLPNNCSDFPFMTCYSIKTSSGDSNFSSASNASSARRIATLSGAVIPPDPIAGDAHDGFANVVADDDFFVDLAGQDQHDTHSFARGTNI